MSPSSLSTLTQYITLKNMFYNYYKFFYLLIIFYCIGRFQSVQLVKSLMVEQKIWGSISAYTKNQMVSWFDDKELSSRADAID